MDWVDKAQTQLNPVSRTIMPASSMYVAAPEASRADARPAVDPNPALALANAGAKIFPCVAGSKEPLPGKSWRARATSDPAKIRAWAAKGYNLAVDLGASGLTVIDLDRNHARKDGTSADGIANFDEQFCHGLGVDIMGGAAVHTPSGGMHLYFRGPVQGVAALGDGIDVKSHGGYVVAPGSFSADRGRRYTAESLQALAHPAELPDSLSTALAAAAAGKSVARQAAPGVTVSAADIAAATRWLEEEAETAVEGSGGEPATIRVINVVLDRVADKDTALALLMAHWNDRQCPPWMEDDLAAKVDNAWQYRQNAPGSDSTSSEFDELPDEPEEAANDNKDHSKIADLSEDDIEAERAEAREYVIKGVLARGDLGVIFGKPGAGKSTLAPYLARKVARGERVFGRRTRQGQVLYVAAEDPGGMRQRVKALRRVLGGGASDLRLIVGVEDLNTKGSSDLKALEAIIKQRQPVLVIIDTLAQAFPGLEENTAEGMGRVVRVGRRLADLGPAVVLIHHDTKGGGDTPRGHSILHGALDMQLKLSSEKGSDIVTGELGKNRNGACDWRLTFRRAVAVLGVDADGDNITAVYTEDLTGRAEAVQAEARADAKDDFIRLLGVLADKGIEGRNGILYRRASFAPTAPNYAPTLLASSADAGFVDKAMLRTAMADLRSEGAIHEKQEMINRKLTKFIVLGDGSDDAVEMDEAA